VVDSEQAASMAAERINALTRLSMKTRDEVDEERERDATPARHSGEDRTAIDRRADGRLEREVLQARQVVDLRRDPALSGCPGRRWPGLVSLGHEISRMLVAGRSWWTIKGQNAPRAHP
jgi:hypothetical protein